MITTDFLPREETTKQVKIGLISSLLIENAIQFITWPGENTIGIKWTFSLNIIFIKTRKCGLKAPSIVLLICTLMRWKSIATRLCGVDCKLLKLN